MTDRRMGSVCAVILALALTQPANAAADLNGVWKVEGYHQQLKTASGEPPPLKPEAAKRYRENLTKWKIGDLSYDPTSKCISPGMPRILYLPYPFEIVQSDRTIAYLFQWNYWNRVIELAPKPQDVPYPLAMGIARGKWIGDTLKIDTIGLRSDNTFLDAAGLPHSDDLHLIEEIRLLDGGQLLEDKITIEDKNVFTNVWSTTVRFRKLPAGTEIQEDICLDRVDAHQPAVSWPEKE
ncbi:hypothetical protein WSK_4350 [Novosphingobium sp. Rr 2-17]|uniref:hypothetical protein n=1 Tax=Novosphingobium sp. Rr 2-17 TaxID=555793 RepID=UPI0002697F39|nr:hypothetical protein [Novosphingobium sp. Rr 2-17]EIZ77087.1 hypothetical protein WSK_4350 [Novosphingobium sp. Rr 2-17]